VVGPDLAVRIGMRAVVSTDAERQLTEARDLLGLLRDALVRFGATAEDQTTLARSIRQLDELFLLVVVGEFNAGKSAFINALIGRPVLPEGVTPTTDRIHLLSYGDTMSRRLAEDGIELLAAPADALRELHIVDTPGTNAIIREHERLTTEFVPRSDLVLFVTSADRPFTETERAFLQTIRDWGKKIVIVINKVDILEREPEVEEVSAFVRDSANRLLGVTPEVFPVSAKLALRAKRGDPAQWRASRFEALERFLSDTLHEEARFQLKLANPLGVGQALAGKYAGIATERLALLQEDVARLDDITRHIALYRTDLARGYEARMSGVENVLLEMERRGHAYFEDTLRLGRVMDLLNRARVQKEFEDRVVGTAPREIERRVTELIDWVIDQEFRAWQSITAALAERRQKHEARLLGSPDVGSFHADRARLMESVGREAHRVVDSYDQQREAARIADDARVAVATAAAAGGAAVGLGTIVTAAASTVAADVTGILLAGVLATIGFLVIPAKRRRAKADLQQKISALRVKLADALRAEFARAQTQSADRIAAAVDPYARFVTSERDRWETARVQLTALDERAAAFRSTALIS
jgi:small GTP-binding protein